jgi:hypothetical protein
VGIVMKNRVDGSTGLGPHFLTMQAYLHSLLSSKM